MPPDHPLFPCEICGVLGVQAAFHGGAEVSELQEELGGAGEILQLARQLATLLRSELFWLFIWLVVYLPLRKI